MLRGNQPATAGGPSPALGGAVSVHGGEIRQDVKGG